MLGVIDLDAEIPDRALDLGMPEQRLDSPEIACPSVDQGGLRASQRMRAEPASADPSELWVHALTPLERSRGA